METKIVKSAGAVIYTILDGNVYYLLLKHKKNGHWGFPKGRISGTESRLDTAKREIFEETGLKNVKFEKGFKKSHKYSFIKDNINHDKEVIFYLAFSPDKKVQLSEEHTEYQWADINKIRAILKKEEVEEIMEKAHKLIIKKYKLNIKK